MPSRECVLEKVKESWLVLKIVDEVWKRDREVVLTAVQHDVRALQFAAEALKGDREIVLAAVQRTGCALQFATDSLRADREIVLEAVQNDGDALRFAAEALKANREVVLAAVRQDGAALRHATEALSADREIVLAAVQQLGLALQCAAEALKADREIVQAAVRQNPGALAPAAHIPRQGALEFAADCLLEDPTFATEVKRQFHLLKLTMLSGTSTVVAAGSDEKVEEVLRKCAKRLAPLALADRTMELWHGQDRVPEDEYVRSFPGLQPTGEITEYQLIVRDARKLECRQS